LNQGSIVDVPMKIEKDERSPCEFPLTYQMDASTRRVLNGLAISIPVLLLIISGFNLAGVFQRRTAPIDLACMNGLSLVLWIWVGAFTNRRVTLYDDAIEMTGWFSRRRLERKDILGYRMGRLAWQAGGSSYYVIVPSTKNLRELALPPFLHADKAFLAWIKDLPKITE
jgi:hypothetical protein